MHQAPSAHAAQRFVEQMLDQIEGAHGVLVATVDGFAIAHAQRRPTDFERMAAIVSSLAALGTAASQETGIGTVRVLVVESTAGRIVTRCLPDAMTVVAVLADTKVPIGMVWTQLRQAEGLLMSA